MTVGIYTFELHLPMARSLKNKRQVVKRLKDRLRAHYNVSVAEMEEHADLWQRAALAVVSVSSSRDALVRLFESDTTYATLLKLGGKQCDALHYQYITVPSRIKREPDWRTTKPDQYRRLLSDAAKSAIVEQIPVGRSGDASDVAGCVLYLVRDATYVTGQIIAVDGGRSIGW